MGKTKHAILLTLAVFGAAGLGILMLYVTMTYFESSEHYFHLLCAVLLLVLGAAVMVGALFTAVFAAEEREGCTVSVRAVITNVRESSVTLGDTRQQATVYVPDYTFELGGETKTVCTYRGSYSSSRYKIGAQEDLLIDPENLDHICIPAEARRKVLRMNLIWVPVMIAGAALYIVGAVLG